METLATFIEKNITRRENNLVRATLEDAEMRETEVEKMCDVNLRMELLATTSSKRPPSESVIAQTRRHFPHEPESLQ